MEAKMEVDGDMVGDCFSVARNIEIGTENVCPPSPACSQISESGISVNSERGKGEQLDLQKVISDSIVDTCKVPMRTLRKACPELYRRCYQTKTGKRKVKYSWDPSHKPSDWPNNVRFVDPNNGIKGKDGRFGNKPGRKELEQMFNFLRDKFVMMSKTECEAEQVVVKMEEKFKHFMGASFKKSKTECEAEQVVVKTEEKPLVKSMQVEESVPAPGPSVDMKKITERRDAALDRIKQQANPDPNVQAQLDRIKTELCGQYNRLLANTPDMRSYMKFFSNCRQIEVLADNMDVFGSAFLEQHFEMQSREVLDGLRELRRPAGGGFRQETSMGHAIQVHGVASSADVTAPHRVPTQNQIHIPSHQPVNTEAPPCDEKVECDEKKCLPDMFEKSTPFQNAEKTVAYCLESELRLPLDWDALFGKPGSWCNDVFEKVAGDEEDMKYAVTEEELFDQLQVQVRNVGPQDKADESKSWEKELKLELPATNLSQYQDDIPMMEGVEASSDLPSLTELTTVASPDAQTSWDASLNHSTFGSQSPVAIHAHFVSQSAVATHDVTASGYCQQDYIGGEIPSFVEAFNEPDPDVMMVDTVMSNTYPDLDESFSDLSNFSFDVDKGYDLH